MALTFKSQRKQKNSADNHSSSQVNINVENNMLQQIYATIIDNSKLLASISVDISYIKENQKEVKEKVDTLDKRVDNLELKMNIVEKYIDNKVVSDTYERIKKQEKK